LSFQHRDDSIEFHHREVESVFILGIVALQFFSEQRVGCGDASNHLTVAVSDRLDDRGETEVGEKQK